MRRVLKALAVSALALWALVVTIPVAAQVYTSYAALDGSPSAPSFAFFSATNSGMYREAVTAAPAFTNAGVTLLRILAAGLGVAGQTRYTGSTTPTINTCGTATVASGGTDSAFQVIITGGTPASCTVNFAATWANIPMCYATDITTAAAQGGKITASTTVLTAVMATTFTGQAANWGADTINFFCVSK